MTKKAHIHRFRDLVAVSLPGDGSTVYLTPIEARQLAAALGRAAHSVERVQFALSAPVTFELPLPGDCQESGRPYSFDRSPPNPLIRTMARRGGFGRPDSWFAYFRTDKAHRWTRVTNGQDLPISYASRAAAKVAAEYRLEQAGAVA